MRRMFRRSLVLGVVLAVVAVPAVAGGVGGFASPLFGLATAPNGDLLVADAGDGVVTVRNGAIRSVASLPGVTDVSPIGRGSMWATTGAGADPEADTGQGLHRVSNGQTRLIANLFAFEEANNPDGAEIDSNPFDVQSLGGRAALVADAGGNDLLKVNNQGRVGVMAVFPDELVSTANLQGLIGCPEPFVEDLAFICDLEAMPAQAVPTSIAVGPDGWYYVGELKGFPAPTGESGIWRVSPNASGAVCGSSPDCVEVFGDGFTSIIDMAFGPDGRLYVAELDELSWAAVEFLGTGAGGTINACDLATLTCEVVAEGVPILTAITFGKDHTLWATTNALIPGAAEVVAIP